MSKEIFKIYNENEPNILIEFLNDGTINFKNDEVKMIFEAGVKHAQSKVNNGVLDDVKECLHPFSKVVSGNEGDFCIECQKYLKTNRL